MNYLDDYLDNAPSQHPITSEISLRYLYDKTYRIHDHESRNSIDDPLSLFALHPKENWLEGGSVYRLIRTYSRYSIKDIANISLLEFLELPRHIVSLLCDMSLAQMELNTKDREADAKMQKELNKRYGKG